MVAQFWVKEDHRAPLLINLVGPIEYWWDTPDEPNRFNSPAAWNYRGRRDRLSQFLTARGYLVYRPHEAFKGGWDERAQVINDAAVVNSDVVINMTPTDVPVGKGTSRELSLAARHDIPRYHFPLDMYSDDALTFLGSFLSHAVRVLDKRREVVVE